MLYVVGGQECVFHYAFIFKVFLGLGGGGGDAPPLVNKLNCAPSLEKLFCHLKIRQQGCLVF